MLNFAPFRQPYLADINATDNLRKIVMRMPDHLIHKSKVSEPDPCTYRQIP